MARRLKLLLGNDVSLAAYHLPLDKHARLGNNTGLADALALGPQRETFGDVRGVALGVSRLVAATAVARGSDPSHRRWRVARRTAAVRVSVRTRASCARSACARARRRICSKPPPRPVAICSSPASSQSASADLAKELQITLVAAGHVATEVFGPMRLADELRHKFPGLDAQFIHVANPL